jgi:ubiquinone biosynthesis protein UbiJ
MSSEWLAQMNTVWAKLGARVDPAFVQTLEKVQAKTPVWLRERVQARVLLALNHVLSTHTEARQRLARQRGRVVRWQWQGVSWAWRADAAGLVEALDGLTTEPSSVLESAAFIPADLTITLQEVGPLSLAQRWLAGETPQIHIQGDVQLAAEVNWLFEHVRWDMEEDLSQVLGDAMAHTLVQGAKRLFEPVKQALENHRRARQAAAASVPASAPSFSPASGEEWPAFPVSSTGVA